MVDGVESAATAFQAVLDGKAIPSSKTSKGANSETGELEVMFADAGEKFTDNSAETDSLGPEKPKPAKKAKKKEDDDDDILYDSEGEPIREQEGGDGDEEGEEGEGDEGDADEGDAEGDEEELDEDEDQKAFMAQEVDVMVDGEEKTVTIREALDGYIRKETLHQRLNKLDEVKDIIGREAAKVIEDRNTWTAKMTEAEELIKSLLPAEPNWDALYAEDPVKARVIEKNYKEIIGKADKIRADREEAARKAAEEDNAQLATYAKTEFPKFARYAKWKDRKSMAKDLQSMVRTASAVGFSKDEYSSVADSRMLTVLLKASKYDRIMAAKPRVKNPEPRKDNGAGRTRTAPKGSQRSMKPLKRTGDGLQDAANVFERMLNRGL